MDETHWIQNARQGDLEAFNCLVLASQDTIFQHAVWMLGEPEAAEDVTQETFLLAHRKLLSLQDGDFCGWLLKIASRLCLKTLRRRGQDHYSPLGVRDDDGEEVISGFRVHGLANSLEGDADPSDLDKVVREGLRKLSPDQRAVVTLVDLQGMDYRKTAEILEISEGSVSSHLARARVQMIELIPHNICDKTQRKEQYPSG